MGILKKFSKLLILDRDGTIIQEVPYLKDESLAILMPNSGKVLSKLQKLGFEIAIATNQSAIGRGIATHVEVMKVNSKVERLLAKFEVSISLIEYCPHLPTDGCDCRKPLPGMGLTIMDKLGYSPKDTIVIGNQLSDIHFAHSLKVRSIFLGDPKPNSNIEFNYCSNWDQIGTLLQNCNETE